MVLPRLIFCLLSVATLAQAQSFDLTPAQAARIQKFLPHSFPKLEKHEPFHAVCIGDSVMLKWGYDKDSGNTLKAWNGILLQELADQFIYTGGVRWVGPPKGQPAKLFNFFGPEITMQSFSRGGRMIFHALQPLMSVAFENKPDLVIVSYGINDAVGGLALDVYRRRVQDIVDVVRAQGADLILCGPSLILNEPPERGMALTRPYAVTMREVADSNGVFFADLGDLAWLLQVDERPEPLAGQKKKSPPADDASATSTTPSPAVTNPPVPAKPGAPAPPPIVSPVADQLNPDADKKAMETFQQVMELMKLKFNHAGTVDWVHPDSATHRALGRRVFQELINGPKAVPWQTGGATVDLEGADKAVLTYRIENTTGEEQTFTLLPLVTNVWKPVEASSRVTLKGGRKSQITVTYARMGAVPAQEAVRTDLFPSHEPYLRLPVLTVGGGTARIEDIRATITPVVVLWNGSTMFNQDGAAELTGRIVNTGAQPLEGRWESAWMGQAASGAFKIETRAEASLKLKLKAPDAPGATRVKGTLGITVSAGGQTFRFDREVEMVRNIGLKETMPLLAAATYVRDKVITPPAPGEAVPGIAFRADADSNAIYLTYDLYGYNLQDNPDGSSAMNVDLHLDARSYGKRLMPGATDAVRVTADAADGDARVAPLPVWCFGTGYGRDYDETQVKAKVTSRPDGARRLTLTLPRAYLYLHEWAMGNGNSQLGLNTTVSLWQTGEHPGAPGSYSTFALTINGRHRDDAESLAVLELTDKPTGRWTVRVY